MAAAVEEKEAASERGELRGLGWLFSFSRLMGAAGPTTASSAGGEEGTGVCDSERQSGLYLRRCGCCCRGPLLLQPERCVVILSNHPDKVGMAIVR
jgi:hypothetical protein